jgi:hypothetical protein
VPTAILVCELEPGSVRDRLEGLGCWSFLCMYVCLIYYNIIQYHQDKTHTHDKARLSPYPFGHHSVSTATWYELSSEPPSNQAVLHTLHVYTSISAHSIYLDLKSRSGHRSVKDRPLRLQQMNNSSRKNHYTMLETLLRLLLPLNEQV